MPYTHANKRPWKGLYLGEPHSRWIPGSDIDTEQWIEDPKSKVARALRGGNAHPMNQESPAGGGVSEPDRARAPKEPARPRIQNRLSTPGDRKRCWIARACATQPCVSQRQYIRLPRIHSSAA